MKRCFTFIVCLLMISFAAYGQYPHKWQAGGTMGLGVTIFPGGDEPMMSLTIGFNKSIHNTRWRWGVEGGLLNQGMVDYGFEEVESDRFVRYNFEYIGAVADYSILSKGESFSFFARGGIAPAHQGDIYIYHTKGKFTALGIIGIGADWNFSKFLITGYISPSGIVTIQFGYGWWFGKRNNNN